MHRIKLSFPSERECPVLVGPGSIRGLAALWQSRWEEAAIIGDENVVRRFAPAVAAELRTRTPRVLVFDFLPGEASKSRETKARLEDQLLEARFGRQGCIVALGGGLSIDVAGFVAATYMRGVAHVNVPTSLLAQVDAAIGGKTAINAPQGKNLIGAFHQPVAVVVDPDVLPSLPAAEWRNGLAEMVKHAIVADEALFDWIDERAERLATPGVLDTHPLRRCLEIKAAIVCADERERGRRAVLNFGHTVGHAVERASSYTIGHGLAVAFGMLVEAAVATRRVGLDEESRRRMLDLWPRLGLMEALDSVALPELDDVLPLFELDKKRASGQLRMALPSAIGEMAVVAGRHAVEVTLVDVAEAWARWRS